MKRALGNTGLEVGVIGLGCEGFVGREVKEIRALVDAASRLGVNYLDLYTSDPDARSGLGKALEGRRDQFILQAHLCTVWKNGQYKRTREIGEVRASFEQMLNQLGTGHVEVGMIHYVDSLEDWKKILDGPVMEYAQTLKAGGRVGHIGLSSHNPQVALKAVQSGLIEVLLFSVNPCYDLLPASEEVEDLWAQESYAHPLLNMDPQREELYESCQRAGVGITVMKAFGGGDLLDAALSPAGVSLTPLQCLHYALTRPGVATVLSGAHTVEQLEADAAYESAGMEQLDYASALAAMPRISWRGHCMYCGHCAPCPVGIEVASVTKFLNLARAQGCLPETVREHYLSLAHKAGECIGCGGCETRCPFEVPVQKNMALAKELFGC